MKRVVVRFPRPISWIGMPGDSAMEFAQMLVDAARQAGCTKPFELRIGEPPALVAEPSDSTAERNA